MKFALFEFSEEKSCEVGETRWIVGEDSACFNNDKWLFNKEVMVRWPSCDSSRILKRIAKSSADIEDGKATTYSAKIVKFSGKLFALYFSTILNNNIIEVILEFTRGRGLFVS